MLLPVTLLRLAQLHFDGMGRRARAGCAQGSTRPDLAVDAIAKRAADPDFGITYGFTMAWADVLLERDHHEFFELTDDNRRARLGRYLTKRRAVLADLVGVLKTLHLQKYGQAEEVSAATIHQLDDGLAAPLHY